ncbi:MAG: lamin tail domain-containing protein [Comamonadaceae bacterium]
MNLGAFESHLIQALWQRLPGNPVLSAGPAFAGPASGVRPEVFVHAARFDDLGGTTTDGAVIARLPWQSDEGASGFAEDRPARVEIDVTFVGAQLWQVQLLSGQASMRMLEALETLDGVSLGDELEARRRLRFTEHRAVLGACRSERLVIDGVAVYRVVLTLRLDGCVRVRLAAPDGLMRVNVHAMLTPEIEVCFNPSGSDLQREHVVLRNGKATLIDLAGWTIEDAARRPHRYRFPLLALLPPGGELRLWSCRGSDNAQNLYWGRRQAVWTNTGDTALLRDPEGVERARADCVAVAPPRKPRRPSA